jgi:hypothetical protein
LLASLGLISVLAGLLLTATASAAPPPNHMTLAEACALPDARCFPLPSSSGVWAMLTQAQDTAPGSASPNLRPADTLREVCISAVARCFPLPSGPARWVTK